jgi:hypothetical protein
MGLNFQEIFMRISLEGKEIERRGIQWKPYKLISSNNMTKFIKRGHHGVIAQLCSLDVHTSIPSILIDLQNIIENHSKVFGEMPKGVPPT